MIVQLWVVWYSSRADLAMEMFAPVVTYRLLQAHLRAVHHSCQLASDCKGRLVWLTLSDPPPIDLAERAILDGGSVRSFWAYRAAHRYAAVSTF